MTEGSLLVVDDEREIRVLVSEYLEAHGFEVRGAANGEEMFGAMRARSIDLVILDLNLPGEDGLELCRRLRQSSRLPVIMLTARGETFDRILGLETGADDYLTKPFEPRELLARIRSVLRRAQPEELAPAQTLRFAGWSLHLAGRNLFNPQGVLVSLSGSEFRLLMAFLESPQRVLSRDQLMSATHGRESDSYDRSMDLQVSRLRQKLRDDARQPQLIKTVRSEGYMLTIAVAREYGH
ncbi:response regulator transcription factor [bacterium]|nr:response regulator transcription factor [bacterium]